MYTVSNTLNQTQATCQVFTKHQNGTWILRMDRGKCWQKFAELLSAWLIECAKNLADSFHCNPVLQTLFYEENH